MKRKMLKRTLAGMLATTMILGMSMTIFAQTGDATGTGNITGTGAFEGHVDKDVVAVTLPTATAETFSYKMDPEGLIAATNGAKHSGASFEDGANVYFLSGNNTWTKDSATLKVINKGTVAVDVTVEAKTADNTLVTMAETPEFAADDTTAKLYLGLKVTNQAPVAVKTDATGKITVGLNGKNTNFEITSTDSGYAYTAKAGLPDVAWNSFEFGLTGACNPKGDYSATGLGASNVTVTWSYVVRADETNPMVPDNATDEAAPSIATKTGTFSKSNGISVSNINLGGGELAATGIKKVQVSRTASGDFVDLETSKWSYNDETLEASGTWGGCNAGDTRILKVIFNDKASTEVLITVTIAD